MSVLFNDVGRMTNKGFRLINTVTTASEVEAVYISQDSNGMPFSLKEIYIEIKAVHTASNTADQNGLLSINAGGPTGYFSTTYKIIELNPLLKSANDGYTVVDLKYLNSKWHGYTYQRNVVNTSNVSVNGNINDNTSLGACTNLTMGNSSAVNHFYFGVGSIVTVWGVDA